MRILVTGYKGFIGRNLSNYLLTQGHDVEGWEYVDNAVPDPSTYDWVIHLGAITSTTYTDVDRIIDQNFEYSMRLLQVCDNYGVNFQYASSASVYGPTTHFTEDGPLLPQSPYAWSKYLFDRFIKRHKDEFNVLVQGFRYFNVYGPWESQKGNQASPISKFNTEALTDESIKLFNDSENYLRDFICVDDVCKVHEQMIDADVSGIFNVGTGHAVSFQAIGEAIAKKHNVNINYIPMPGSLKGSYQEFTQANIEKLSKYVNIDFIKVEDYIDNV